MKFPAYTLPRHGKLAVVVALVAFLMTTGLSLQSQAYEPHKVPSDRKAVVAVTQIVDQAALNAAYKGIVEGLRQAGWEDGKNMTLTWESAQGSLATAAQMAQKLVSRNPDVVIAISTPSAQTVAAAAAGTDVPVVFSVITDPVGSQLVKSMEEPGVAVTGTTDMLDLDGQIAMLRQAVPGLKRLGIVYSPGEANAVSMLKKLKVAANRAGVEILEATAPRVVDINAAANSLVNKVDAFYVLNDNTMLSGIESLVQVSYTTKVPVFSGDTDSVGRGAAAAISYSFFDMGVDTGKMAARILAGEDPRKMPVERGKKLALHLNLGSAQKMGLTFSKEMLDAAEVKIP